MRFKNSIILIFENFKTVYKILLFRLIVITILLSLTTALIMPNIMRIVNSSQLSQIITLVRQFVRALLKGQVSLDFDEQFKDAFINFYNFIKLQSGRFIVSGFILGAIFFIGRFLNGLSNYATGVKINDHMTSLSDFGFMHCLFRSFKTAALQQLVYCAVTFVYDLLILLICYQIMFGLFFAFGFFSVVLAATVFVALIAFRLTLLSDFLPATVADKEKVCKAFINSFKSDKRQFLRKFSTYFASMFLLIYLNVSMAVFTFFSGLIITLPLSYLFLICVQFVSYFIKSGRKYFINYDNIVTPKQLRSQEKNLNDIEI